MKLLTVSVACLAIAFSGTAVAATDGTLGPTSNGSFNVTANISAPEVDSVHVYGLDDLVFPGTAGETQSTWQIFFCMTREPNAGQIGVTISSIAAADTAFLLKSPGGDLPLIIQLGFEDFDQFQQLNEGTEATYDAPNVCDAETGGSGNPDSARMDLTINGVPEDAGSYSNTFLISVAPK